VLRALSETIAEEEGAEEGHLTTYVIIIACFGVLFATFLRSRWIETQVRLSMSATPLPAAQRLLPATCCSLPAAQCLRPLCCPLPAAHCLPRTACRPQPAPQPVDADASVNSFVMQFRDKCVSWLMEPSRRAYVRTRCSSRETANLPLLAKH
jgi:hypothetical protein